jgi:ABC-type lipoprotein release transport system permease subunit
MDSVAGRRLLYHALPVDLTAVDVAVVALSAMAICFLATLYPAQQASRFNPLEAIRLVENTVDRATGEMLRAQLG